MEPVYLAVLWHMHQPYYKNLATNEYFLPWVLLHGTKDYLDMAYMLKDFPGIKQNFNVVPSLLVQLDDYANDRAVDLCLELFKKDARTLTRDDRAYILQNFFNANWENMVKPYRRYYELLRKRGFYVPRGAMQEVQRYFTEDEMRDIQVFFYLAWIDPVFFDIYDGLRLLREKGRRFSEDDKKILLAVQKDILAKIVPLYKDYAQKGIIELSTSPFYHPIIPLLIDTDSARESMPDAVLPVNRYRYPEDAREQIRKAKSLFHEQFGFHPNGMWPPEGSVSDDALSIYASEGVEWLLTDEAILFESLKIDNRRDGRGVLANPAMLYRPYRWHGHDGEMSFVFRDRELSDLISFHYSRADAKDAAADCLRRIRDIRASLQGSRKPLVTIAMDGENAWESFKNDGRDFLSYLYEGILRDEGIIPVTVSEYLAEAENFGSFQRCFAGSWIGHNFSIWIGHPEDNAGWSYLATAREFIEKEDPKRTNSAAWESIYIAEGSDWFWWYGDDHSSENDEVFDFLFRENLSNVYRFLGKEPPAVFGIPILMEEREVCPARVPVDLLEPVIDGRVTSYFEWMGSGFIEGRGHGTAMHETKSTMVGLYYGFSREALFLRIDIDNLFIEEIKEFSFEITIMKDRAYRISYLSGTSKIESAVGARAVFSEILEVAVPFAGVGAEKGDTVCVWVSLKAKDMEMDRIPNRGFLAVKVPSENFEAEMWYV